jgi:P27 family predicted phage terminase small subunit
VGAIPKPIPLKLLEARSPNTTRGGAPMPEAPDFVRIAPTPPTFMSREAKAEWKRIVPGLTRLDLTKEEDRAALVAYCECWSRFVAAQKIINEEGLLAVNSQGRVRHPAVAVVEAASKELRSWVQEFGLSPAAENRVAGRGQRNGSEADPFDD